MLRITAATLLASVIAGWLAGGRLRNLAAARLTALPLTFASAGLVVAARFAGETAAAGLQIAAAAVVAAFLGLNLARVHGAWRVGFAVLVVGWGLNAIVVAANGGMPLSLPAYAASGQTEAPTPGEGGFFAVTVADESTVLAPLGDVIPVPPLRAVASLGDLVLALGIVIVVGAGMRAAAPGAAASEFALPRRHGSRVPAPEGRS